jgi:DNA-binding NarL/FixJ family response regulator
MKRVLIIENQAAFREALAKLLENEADFEVAGQAGSLAQGHDLALDGLGKLDAAVVGLLLPDDNWTNFIRELRAAKPDLPVLVLTMTQDPEVHARVLEAGVDEVLTKAVSLEEIFATIRRLEDV